VRILLVNPAQSVSLYTFSEISDITGVPAFMPNLAIGVLAALTPPSIQVECVDENCRPIDYETDWDLVGITGYITQAKRMFEIADEFRSRGHLVAIGGPYASLSPSTVRPHADVLFLGEAEYTWPQFLRDVETGGWHAEYRQREPVDIHDTPEPDMRGVGSSYWIGVVQTSRGCPFECEFCDVIVYLGRKQRHKTPQRVVSEIRRFHELGYRSVFLSDDNFTANRQRATEIMTAVRDWNSEQREPMTFSTQLSIDIARQQDTELLDLCAAAGLRQAFVGIETPNEAALLEVKKRQNVRASLAADVAALHRRGIIVQAGMISGFDADTLGSFQLQFDFLQGAGIPVVSVSTLNAPEGTPLDRRLRSENRLKIVPVRDLYLETNIIPKQMTNAELRNGTQWLLNRLYDPVQFLERVRVLASTLPRVVHVTRSSPSAAYLWSRILTAFDGLGAEFRNVPREAVAMFRGKETQALATALMFFCNAVRVLRKWGVWDPELGKRSAPDFAAEVRAKASAN
jgi:radical SAM superfamily enzyme YgiQ (UPF0313 family)